MCLSFSFFVSVNDLITKRKQEFESDSVEIISLELTISRKKWIIFSFYRPPKSNIANFFSELSKCVDKATRRYENVVLMGDINIDTSEEKAIGMTKLSEFCDIFDLVNLITCETLNSSTSLDVILTNKKRSFKNSGTIETRISDLHKMTITTMRVNYQRLQPIKVQYRSYKNFQEKLFLKDLKKQSFEKCKNIIDKDEAYDHFKEIFVSVVNKHAPLKTKFIRGNHAPFMNKELSKAIMYRSKLRNIHNKKKTKETWEAFKRQQNKCVSIKHRNIRNHFKDLAKKHGANGKMFWTAVKPFLTNKESSKGQGITLEVADDQLDDKIKVAEELNESFVNIVEITTGKKPSKHSYSETGIVNEDIINELIDKYKNHESIKQIRSNYDANMIIFSFRPSTSEDIRKIIHDLRARTSIGFNNVPPKLLKTASDIISKPLSNLINETMIKCSHFPNTEKIVCITPAFKKDDRHKKENYQPVSVLHAFFKIFERFLLDQMAPYLENILSVFISAYRKHYSCQHVFLRMIEMWQRCLYDNKMVGTILMDLSKAFDCLAHDLLIAKLDAYGFDKEALRLILSYLSGRKQCVKNGGCLSMLKLILNGVPQGSILGPILFNVFINDIFNVFINNIILQMTILLLKLERLFRSS